MIKASYRTVRLLGGICIGLAAFHMAVDYYGRAIGGHAFDPGVVAANEAVALIGFIAQVIAQALKDIEARLPPKQSEVSASRSFG
jgi:hypothetical protein